MNSREKEDLIARLETRFSSASGNGSTVPVADRVVRDALQRMVAAGAERFGVRADEPQRAGFSACDLAPPMARMIDHTALKAETSEAEVRSLCEDALRYCFASVCINPCYVSLASSILKGSAVAVCTVIGFPLGATTAEVKARETEQAVRNGAREVDMVLNIGLMKSGRYDEVERDIRAVVESALQAGRPGAGSGRVLVKVILETALLTDEEKVIACVLSQNAGADFVKTSTGFSSGGATAADVALMRRVVGESMGVKASGGIRSKEDVETMVRHGASRIGASASVAIVKGLQANSDY
jgi:deoxyribose-phosphate aldolase